MRVGVLGGTRFIGFHLVEALLTRGDSVTIFHRGRTREPRPFAGAPAQVLGDRDRPSDLEGFFKDGYDAVIDLTAYAPRHVEPLLARWRDRVGHYVFCSTSSVAKDPAPGYTEDAPLAREPGTYGGDKASAEDLVLAALPATVFRPQGVFGPYGAEQALYALRRLAAGEPVLTRPQTSGKRLTFLWVGDLVDAFLRAIDRPSPGGRVYNAAGPDPCDIDGFVSRLASVSGTRPSGTVALDARLAARLPHLGIPWLTHDLVADAGKLSRELGWKPLPLDEGLRRTWEWARSEPGLLRFKPQRWERQAREGRRPPPWVDAGWRLYDAVRPLLP